MALALIGLGLAVAAVRIELNRPGELERWMAEQEERGERFSLRDLVSPVDLEMAQAAQQLTGAVARLQISAVDPATLRLMRPLLPGHARVLWKEEAIPGSGGWLDTSWENLAAQMRSNAPVLREINALLRSHRPGPAHDLNVLKVSRASLVAAEQRCAEWLASAEIDALRRGALDEAVDEIHAIISLARMNEKDYCLANLLNRVTLAGTGVAATWEALHASGWDESRLGSLQQSWEGLTFLAGLERALVFERAWGVSLFEPARTNRHGLREFGLTMGCGSTNPLPLAFNHGICLPIWQTAWAKGDELYFLQRSQAALDLMRAARINQSYAGLPADLEAALTGGEPRRPRLGEFRFMLSDALIARWDRLAARVLRQEVLQQMTVVAIAVRRYQVGKGRVPDGLPELVPEFLATLPRDALTGGELQYRCVSDGHWILYSQGDNRLDEDGGGDDVVWPATGYVEDITSQPSTGEQVAIIAIDGVSLTDAIRNLARHARINFQFDSRVTERWHPEVSLRRENVSAEEVLKRLLRERGLSMLRDKRSAVVRITSEE